MTRQVAVSTAGNDAAITLAAQENNGYVLHHIVYSYSNLLTNSTGNLTVTSNSVTVLDMDIVTGNNGIYEHDIITENVNQAIVITLDGVSTAIGKLSIEYSTY